MKDQFKPYFNDVERIVDGQQGIFGGESALGGDSGLTDFQSAPSDMDSRGVIYRVRCENDGPLNIIVEFPEFVAAKFGLSPHVAYQGTGILTQPVSWGFSQEHQAWFPDMRCSRCGYQIQVMIQHGEIEAHLRNAVARGLLPEVGQAPPPQGQPWPLNALQQVCMSRRQQMQQMPHPQMGR